MKLLTLIFVLVALISIAHCTDLSHNDNKLIDKLMWHRPVVLLPRPRPQPIPLVPYEFDNAPKVHRVRRQNQISIDAERRRNAGTNVNIDAQARLWESQNRRSTLDGNANYNRQFGGPGGTGRPNYGGGLTFKHRF